MGTHPIFESDFDCLTESIENERFASLAKAQDAQSALDSAQQLLEDTVNNAGLDGLMGNVQDAAQDALSENIANQITDQLSNVLGDETANQVAEALGGGNGENTDDKNAGEMLTL